MIITSIGSSGGSIRNMQIGIVVGGTVCYCPMGTLTIKTGNLITNTITLTGTTGNKVSDTNLIPIDSMNASVFNLNSYFKIPISGFKNTNKMIASIEPTTGDIVSLTASDYEQNAMSSNSPYIIDSSPNVGSIIQDVFSDTTSNCYDTFFPFGTMSWKYFNRFAHSNENINCNYRILNNTSLVINSTLNYTSIPDPILNILYRFDLQRTVNDKTYNKGYFLGYKRLNDPVFKPNTTYTFTLGRKVILNNTIRYTVIEYY